LQSGPDPPTPKLPEDWFERFELGLTEFNQGKFYDCHETLERCWQEQGRLEEAMQTFILGPAPGPAHGPVKGSVQAPIPVPMQDPHREWVQGLIQIAVAYHHLERDNVKGALKLLVRGFARIKKFPLITYPLELGPFEAIVQSTIEQLEGLSEPVSMQSKVQFPKVAHK